MKVPTGVLPDVDDPEFAPFWAAARDHRIDIPACAQCGRMTWPPRPICADCHGFDFVWTAVASTGTLFTWTVVHHATVESMPCPYVIAIVAVDRTPSVRLLGNLWDVNLAELKVGLPLVARFDAASEHCTLINWVPARSA